MTLSAQPVELETGHVRLEFKGEFPEELATPAPEGHVNKRRLKTPRFG